MAGSKSFTHEDLIDVDSIKTSVATSASAASYSGAALDGAFANPGPAVALPAGHSVAMYPAATASSSAGSYVDESTVVFTGTYLGESATRTATVSGTDGNASFIADGPLDSCSQVDVESQADVNGSWQFGFQDIDCGRQRDKPHAPRRRWTVAVHEAGDLHASYDGRQDAAQACVAGQVLQGHPTRIHATTTTADFTVNE